MMQAHLRPGERPKCACKCGVVWPREYDEYADPYDNKNGGVNYWVRCDACGNSTKKHHNNYQASLDEWELINTPPNPNTD